MIAEWGQRLKPNLPEVAHGGCKQDVKLPSDGQSESNSGIEMVMFDSNVRCRLQRDSVALSHFLEFQARSPQAVGDAGDFPALRDPFKKSRMVSADSPLSISCRT